MKYFYGITCVITSILFMYNWILSGSIDNCIPNMILWGVLTLLDAMSVFYYCIIESIENKTYIK